MRVLHNVVSMDKGGGVQNQFVCYYEEMEKRGITFDFVANTETEGGLDPWFEERGCKVYHLRFNKKHPFKYVRELWKLLTQGEYDALHNHMGYQGALILLLAKFCGMKNRVTHAHGSNESLPMMRKLLKWVGISITKLVATDFLAVSQASATWMYGTAYVKKNKVEILYNPIPTEKFAYDPKVRHLVRDSFGLADEVLLGNVGRFTDQKNHRLLLRVFARYLEQNPKTRLMLVGEGKLFLEVKNYARELGVYDKVFFLGIRDDVHELVQAMDVMVHTAAWEGFGNVLLEAQAASLPCIVSDNLPSDVKLTDAFSIIPAADYENVDAWCKRIDEALAVTRLEGCPEEMTKRHDPIKYAERLCEIYEAKNR